MSIKTALFLLALLGIGLAVGTAYIWFLGQLRPVKSWTIENERTGVPALILNEKGEVVGGGMESEANEWLYGMK